MTGQEESINIGVHLTGTIEKKDINGETFEIVEFTNEEGIKPKVLFRKNIETVPTDSYVNGQRIEIGEGT